MGAEQGRTVHVVFVGNPNCGKTTLFNALTESNVKVGNWPGVTVEKIEGVIEVDDKTLHIIDLPGIYSLETYTTEEIITRRCLAEDEIDVIVNIVDATALERHLYLTLQLLKIEKPMILVLNMIDLVEKHQIFLDIDNLSGKLGGIPVVKVSAAKKTGLLKLIDLISVLKNQEGSGKQNIPVTYDEVKLIIKECWIRPADQRNVTDRVDFILMHPILGIPAFLLIMGIVFWLTFTVGDWLKEYVQMALTGISYVVSSSLQMLQSADWVEALVTDGIIAGVGVVITFLPNLIILFIAMAVMEDSGYMARVAYVMNEVMGSIGLSGKAFIPMLLGFGCTVPAIVATRILGSDKEKKAAMILLPFMSCSAKLPIYLLFSSIFFKSYAFLVVFFLYVFSFLSGLGIMFVLKRRRGSLEYQDLLIELPEYHLPDLLTVYVYVREKVVDYIFKAGSTIFAASVLLWVLLHMNWHGPVGDVSYSFAADIGKTLVPVLQPIGLGQWQLAVALIAGLSAKEVVVASFSVLFGIQNLSSAEGIYTFTQILSAMGIDHLQAFVFLLFCAFYTPCISALAMIRRETRSLWQTLGIGMMQIGIAWSISFLFYQLGRILSGIG